jgi:hypothetical protein
MSVTTTDTLPSPLGGPLALFRIRSIRRSACGRHRSRCHVEYATKPMKHSDRTPTTMHRAVMSFAIHVSGSRRQYLYWIPLSARDALVAR